MTESNTERFERIKRKTSENLMASDLLFMFQKTEYALQAEPVIKKVAELNEFISNTNIDPKRWGDSVIDIAIDELGRLKSENYQLREVLEFYGNRDNHTFPPADTPDAEWYEALSIIRQDSGERARKALEGER